MSLSYHYGIADGIADGIALGWMGIGWDWMGLDGLDGVGWGGVGWEWVEWDGIAYWMRLDKIGWDRTMSPKGLFLLYATGYF